MKIGASYPTTEVPADPDVVRKFVAALDELGFTHMMAYDHVLTGPHEGREGKLAGPYTDKDSFHDPFVLFAFAAALSDTTGGGGRPQAVPQRRLARRMRMVLERAEFMAKEGMGDEAVEVLRTRGLPLATTYTGCQSFKALRCVEYPDTIMFLAEWDSIEAHLASREEPAHTEFRALLMPYAAGAKETVHFTQI